MQISVINHTTCIPDSDVKIMISACNVLLPQVAKDWNISPLPIVNFRDKNTKSPANWVFAMIDVDASQPDALAYHTEIGDNVVGYILCKTILDNGGVTLYKDNQTPTVASALFHELAEALVDPTVNIYWQNGSGDFITGEVCDPVQDNIVLIPVPDPVHLGKIINVGLSDYVLPVWKDTEAARAKFNYLNTLPAPFTMSPGGYMVKLTCGSSEPQYVWGERVSSWVKDLKRGKVSRSAKKYNKTKK